jgi:hypothetical protein
MMGLAKGALGPLLGGALDKGTEWYAESLLNKGMEPGGGNVLQDLILDHYMDNFTNQLVGTQRQVTVDQTRANEELAESNTQKLIEDIIKKYGGTPQGSSSGGRTNVLGQTRDPGSMLGTWVSPTSQAAIRSGAGVIGNDAWGDAARGFGIGAGSGGSAGQQARADAIRFYRKE